MKINSIDGAMTQTGGVNPFKAEDPVSRNIQSRIANARKQLQELSADEEMSLEEKRKKREEIQQQLMDLNNQLRQQQLTQRRERQEKRASMEDMLGGSRQAAPKAGKQGTGLSQASMEAVIGADSAMEMARIQGGVANRMEGRAGVLEAEIKLDAGRGQGVEKKQEELAEVQQKAAAAQAAQIHTLADANKELEEARKTDQKEDEKAAASVDSVSDNTDASKVGKASATASGNTEASTQNTMEYAHVDVRL